MLKGFKPVFDSGSKILILGSFPSVKSRAVNFYYGNPQNRFWRMLEAAFDESIGTTVSDKKNFLSRHHIALWDIATACDIIGSSDNKIRNAVAADLSIILNHASITKILCNGKTAFTIFQKHYNTLKIPAVCLPSTSPANPSFSLTPWITALTEHLPTN